jgi:transcriptional regulator with XRE-family HTH domain
MAEATFGELLKNFRKQTGKTQVQLQVALENLDYTIDSTTLSKYELGERRPDASFIPYFAKALHLSEREEQALLHAYLAELEISAREDYLRGKSDVG